MRAVAVVVVGALRAVDEVHEIVDALGTAADRPGRRATASRPSRSRPRRCRSRRSRVSLRTAAAPMVRAGAFHRADHEPIERRAGPPRCWPASAMTRSEPWPPGLDHRERTAERAADQLDERIDGTKRRGAHRAHNDERVPSEKKRPLLQDGVKFRKPGRRSWWRRGQPELCGRRRAEGGHRRQRDDELDERCFRVHSGPPSNRAPRSRLRQPANP